MADLPDWADELVTLYESGANCQFLLHGNVDDIFLLPLDEEPQPGDLDSFLSEVLLPPFQVVLSYDLARGLRIVRGESFLEEWPSYSKRQALPRAPGEAIAMIDHFLRYCANLNQMATRNLRPAIVIKGASLIVPAAAGTTSHDISAMALQVRQWSMEQQFLEAGFVTFLVAENLNDLNPLLVNNSRAAHINIPLPDRGETAHALAFWRKSYPKALEFFNDPEEVAAQLMGASLSSLSGLLKKREHLADPLRYDDLARLKKGLVEKECSGLIEFIESDQTLDAIHGQEAIKTWLRQDIGLWRKNDLRALPMGYLFCGPVGTGKTYLVKCLAGEAGVPVVKFKNFRDRWVGSTEGNLEKIFRLLHALGRCIVFVDEADQALGRRNSSGDSSGVSGRVYSMMAEEMSKTSNRGKILWVLASSRPDLIEVDLKRPGRVDVKVPLFPTATAAESLQLIGALCGKFGLDEIGGSAGVLLEEGLIPPGMTPGAAEALAVKVYRLVKTDSLGAVDALRACLIDYQKPVPKDVMDFQIRLAVEEATDLSFVPEVYRI